MGRKKQLFCVQTGNFNIKDLHYLVVVFQPLTAPCTARTLAQDQAEGWWSRTVSGSLCRVHGRGEERGGDVLGEEDEARRLTAQGNARVWDVTAGQWQRGSAASLRDQDGWRVNYYSCSQYLTGLTPCPSDLYPDSTEGRAKNMAIVSFGTKYVFKESPRAAAVHGLKML